MSVKKLLRKRFRPAFSAIPVFLLSVSTAHAEPTITGISTSPSSPIPDGAKVVVTIHGQGAAPANEACGVEVTIDGLPGGMIPVQAFPATFDWLAKIPKPPLQDAAPATHSTKIVASGAAVGVWGPCQGSASAQVTVGDPWKNLKKMKGPEPKLGRPGPKPTAQEKSGRELDPEKPKPAR